MRVRRAVLIILAVSAAAPAPARGADGPVDKTASVQAVALSDLNVGWLERQGRTDRWGRDPFAAPPQRNAAAAPPAAAPNTGDLHVSAIIHGQGRGLVIINNQILRKGDRIGDREIVDIQRDRVVLRDAAGEQDLRVEAFTR